MSKFVKLLTSAYVNGRLRHPHEGVLHLDDDEAKRLIDNESAEDVTKDFSAQDRKEVPVEGLTANADTVSAAAQIEPVPHQAELPTPSPEDAAPEEDAPSKADAKTPKAAKPAT